MRDLRYAISLVVSTLAAAGVLSGLLLFVAWAGWVGAAGIAAAVGIFLGWFYRGRRPDLAAGKSRREGGGDAGTG